jgi:hypothetical protein
MILEEFKNISGSLGKIWLLMNTDNAFYASEQYEFSDQRK